MTHVDTMPPCRADVNHGAYRKTERDYRSQPAGLVKAKTRRQPWDAETAEITNDSAANIQAGCITAF